MTFFLKISKYRVFCSISRVRKNLWYLFEGNLMLLFFNTKQHLRDICLTRYFGINRIKIGARKKFTLKERTKNLILAHRRCLPLVFLDPKFFFWLQNFLLTKIYFRPKFFFKTKISFGPKIFSDQFFFIFDKKKFPNQNFF